ncbi:MAG: MATE family efflux transporter [Oscillospiraceae bacterium]
MKNTIGRDFHFFSLLKFALPSIVMMIVMGLYTIIDSMFVSRFVGTNALSAINIVYPIINVIIALAIMLATGGSAIIAKKMGDGDEKSARENFTFIVLVGVVVGVACVAVGLIFLRPIIYALGASDILFEYCYEYLLIMLLFAPVSILQMLFQVFFVTAGKPTLGLVLTVSAGLVNVLFDYIFIVPLNMGLAGAALGTGIGYLIPAVVGVLFFFKKKGALHFTRPKFELKVLWESCYNGSSEMVTNLAMGVTTFLFNIIMMRYLGEDGVAAITIVLYVNFLMTALYMGFSMGVAPVISYNYGSGNTKQLKRIYKICLIFICVSSIIVFIVSILLSSNIVTIFSQKGTNVYQIAMEGFRLYPISFLFAGFNIFASAMFTAFSNGKVSAIISFMRTFVFLVLGLLMLPFVFEVNGVWLAVPVAELLTLVVSAVYIYKGKKTYHYG